jgi:hypothetical protein
MVYFRTKNPNFGRIFGVSRNGKCG